MILRNCSANKRWRRGMLHRLTVTALVWTLSIPVGSPKLAANQAQPTALTNADVVKLVEAGLSPEVVIASIRQARERNFTLTPDALIELKKKGVPDSVIAVLLNPAPTTPAAAPNFFTPRAAVNSNDPAEPHEHGIYLDSGEGNAPRLIRLAETTTTGTRAASWRSALTGGLAKESFKYRVRDPQAEHRIASPQPVFYLYETDPRDIVLLKLEKKGNEREFTAMEWGFTGTRGPKGDAEFVSEKVADGIYKLMLSAPLKPGEYGFGINMAGGVLLSVYDFGVDALSKQVR